MDRNDLTLQSKDGRVGYIPWRCGQACSWAFGNVGWHRQADKYKKEEREDKTNNQNRIQVTSLDVILVKHPEKPAMF